MAAVAEGSDEDVGPPQPTAAGIVQLSHPTKVHLPLFSWGRVHAHECVWLARSQPIHEPPYGRITAQVLVVILQMLPDRHHLDALIDPRLHDVPVRLDTRLGARCLGRVPQRRCQHGVIRQGTVRVQVSLRLRPCLVFVHRRTRHTQVLGNAPLALASAQTIDQLSQVVHMHALHVVHFLQIDGLRCLTGGMMPQTLALHSGLHRATTGGPHRAATGGPHRAATGGPHRAAMGGPHRAATSGLHGAIPHGPL